ncbi:MAG: hypothetical protein ACJLTB_17790 [Algoriphagus aquaeductus]|uniref:hypothetical protein n=1 Tax=Algoriphagus TaxID=246875 RepID=UPI00259124FE|nr:hypothetical protein [Algoriphagus sp.]
MKAITVYKRSFLVLIFLLRITACNFAPGSYPYREEYELNSRESRVIEVIKEFKEDNPEFIVPSQTQLSDGRNDEEGQEYWYHIYFYYPEENQIIYTWTRPAENGKTTFALISINDGLTLGKWKEINKDFNRSENRDEKNKFEERILNKIKAKL